MLQMIRFESLGPEETADTCHLFEANADVFTLVGLDDDWEPIGLEPNHTQDLEHSFLDDDDLDCMALDLDASSGFPCHARAGSDIPQCYDLGTKALDQPVLDMDSDDEMGEESVLDF